MHKRSLLPRAVSAMLLALTACHDLPTADPPAIPAPAASAGLNQGQHTGQKPFYCTVREYAPSTPNGWETRRMTVFIPRGELHDGGRTVRYAYIRVFPSGRIFSSKRCDVPYAEGALRRVDRVLGVEKNGGADQFRARQGMITTQGCVTDVCPLEPIVIPAPLKPTREPDDVCERYPGECASDGGGGGGGEDEWGYGGGNDGSGGDDPLEGDEDGDGDTLDEGPLAFAGCVAVGIGVDGWISMGGAAYAGIKLFDARSDVRSAYSSWRAYAGSANWRDDFSSNESDRLYMLYVYARDNEENFVGNARVNRGARGGEDRGRRDEVRAAVGRADNMRTAMQGTPRWLHVGFGAMNAVVLCAMIYVVARGLLLGKPWWLVLGPALVLPEITRMALVEFGSVREGGPADHGVTQLVTRTLSVLGILLLFVGVSSM